MIGSPSPMSPYTDGSNCSPMAGTLSPAAAVSHQQQRLQLNLQQQQALNAERMSAAGGLPGSSGGQQVTPTSLNVSIATSAGLESPLLHEDVIHREQQQTQQQALKYHRMITSKQSTESASSSMEGAAGRFRGFLGEVEPVRLGGAKGCLRHLLCKSGVCCG